VFHGAFPWTQGLIIRPDLPAVAELQIAKPTVRVRTKDGFFAILVLKEIDGVAVLKSRVLRIIVQRELPGGDALIAIGGKRDQL
jgi:hypothetical protein